MQSFVYSKKQDNPIAQDLNQTTELFIALIPLLPKPHVLKNKISSIEIQLCVKNKI
jgi:hypothetical protein